MGNLKNKKNNSDIDVEVEKALLNRWSENETTMMLQCQLTDQEILKLANEGSSLHVSIIQKESDLKSVINQFKAEIETYKSRLNLIQSCISSKKETRNVIVKIKYDWKEGLKHFIRTDTLEEIKLEPIEAHEKQTEMRLDDAESFFRGDSSE